MISLDPFCLGSIKNKAPFSWNDHTYATNGHIIVRVERRGDVPEHPEPPEALSDLFKEISMVPWRPLRKIDLPKLAKVKCDTCDGRGHEHDCPDCTCTCEDCGGTGKLEEVPSTSINVGPAIFNARYISLMGTLPDIRVPEVHADPNAPMPFRFDGGDGLLMPLRHKYVNHMEPPA